MANVRSRALNIFLIINDCVVYYRLSMGLTVGLVSIFWILLLRVDY